MTKDVIISLTGFQFMQEDGEPEPVAVVTGGQYYFKNGTHYLIYDELVEGFSGSTHNIIKFRPDRLQVHKKGLINVEMIFEEGKKTSASYMTPLGVIDMGLAATGFSLEEEENRILFHVEYSLSVDQAYSADCRIDLEIRSKEEGNFRLDEGIEKKTEE
ncbi:MAG: DUF1934 domain-containing protein [Eubacterium sp.]|jgi:uncharacterized beta-barrel protein YwiB (DUF1934 family)|nr:DUF1934 domain-containing protein [Eubacterium sp.]